MGVVLFLDFVFCGCSGLPLLVAGYGLCAMYVLYFGFVCLCICAACWVLVASGFRVVVGGWLDLCCLILWVGGFLVVLGFFDWTFVVLPVGCGLICGWCHSRCWWVWYLFVAWVWVFGVKRLCFGCFGLHELVCVWLG